VLQPGWVYSARVHHIIDTNTLRLVIDLGFHRYTVEVINLDGCGPLNLARLAFVTDWLAEAGTSEWPLVIATRRNPRGPGPYLARVLRASDGAELYGDLLLAGWTSQGGIMTAYRHVDLITALRVGALNLADVAEFIADEAYPRFTRVTNSDDTLRYYDIPRAHGLLRAYEGDYLTYGTDNILRVIRAWDFGTGYYVVE
jgi:hypothetical protein